MIKSFSPVMNSSPQRTRQHCLSWDLYSAFPLHPQCNYTGRANGSVKLPWFGPNFLLVWVGTCRLDNVVAAQAPTFCEIFFTTYKGAHVNSINWTSCGPDILIGHHISIIANPLVRTRCACSISADILPRGIWSPSKLKCFQPLTSYSKNLGRNFVTHSFDICRTWSYVITKVFHPGELKTSEWERKTPRQMFREFSP